MGGVDVNMTYYTATIKKKALCQKLALFNQPWRFNGDGFRDESGHINDKGLAFLSLPLSSSRPWSAAVEEEEDGLGAGANELAVATWSRQVHG